MRKNILFSLFFLFAAALCVNAEDAVLGEKITNVADIKDGGVYAIYGLLNCDPVNGSNGKGRFYKSDKIHRGDFKTDCAFVFTSTGEGDGSFFIQSVADGKLWGTCTDESYMATGEAHYYRSMAAKIKFVPAENEGLPGSFVMYEYVPSAKREIGDSYVSTPYVVAQDWGSLAWCSYTSLAENDNTGSGEWYIYNVTMNAPYEYMLDKMVTAVGKLGLDESLDPGKFSDLKDFPETYEMVKVVAKDSLAEQEANGYIQMLLDAFDDIVDIEPNAVTSGVYVIENGYNGFYGVQKVTKSLFFETGHTDENGNYALYWKTSPTDIFAADSMFYFELLPAGDSQAAEFLLEDGSITEEQKKDLYFIRNPKCGLYIGWAAKPGVPVYGTAEPTTPYIIVPRGDYFVICNPESQYYSLSPYNHLGGNGPDNFIEYADVSYQASIWRLRLVDDYNSTSISAPDSDAKELLSVTYYSVCGTVLEKPAKGVNIVKYVYSDASVETKKVIIK